MPATEIELKVADGDYLFALRLPQLAALQDARKAGIFAIYARVLKGRYMFGEQTFENVLEAEAFSDDIYETIRLGLIGGGKGTVDGVAVEVTALKARAILEQYIHPAPLREAWAIAAAVLGAKIEGYDPGPKAEPASAPARSRKRGSRKASTPSAPSSTAPASASTGND